MLHLTQLQELERTHQQALLKSDEKNQRKDYARKKKGQAKESLQEEKAAKKANKGPELKEKIKVIREALAAAMAKQDLEFEERLKAVKEEEEKSLIEHQEHVKSQCQKQHEKRAKELHDERQVKIQQHLHGQLESRNTLRLQQESEIIALENNEKELQLTLQKEQHDALALLQLAQFKEVDTVLQTHHAEQKTVLSEYQRQTLEVSKDNADALLALWDQLEKEQREQLAALQNNHEKEKAALAAKLADSRNALIAEQNARKSRVSGSGHSKGETVFGNPVPTSGSSPAPIAKSSTGSFTNDNSSGV